MVARGESAPDPVQVSVGDRRWVRQDMHYIESEDCRYTVSKNPAPDGDGYQYLAWKRAKPSAELLGVFDSADEAKACCENDRERAAA
jgi:hypothetical protein